MPAVAVPVRSRRRPLGRYQPTRFGQTQRWRFARVRRAEYLARAGEITSWQSSTIETLVQLEWAALVCEHRFADLQAAREGREHRRLFQRLLSDFERSVEVPVRIPSDPAAAIHAHFAARRSGGAAA